MKTLIGVRPWLAAITVLLCLIFTVTETQAIRIKDMAKTQGVRENQLIGYGLVVGLNGTGDGNQSGFTTSGLINMMENMGLHLTENDVKVKNVAGVIVTTPLPPFAKVGQRIDVVVSSLGDAKSLQGGTLLATPLKGLDGKVYAIAQGPVGTGGFAVAGAAGGTVQKNHPTVARIPEGATVEREVAVPFAERKEITLNLDSPDFTTVSRMVAAINGSLSGNYAQAKDGGTINVALPESYKEDTIGFMAAIENLDVVPDQPAKVVLDERTGTVVMGENVRLSKVAVSHGNLSLQIRTGQTVSQPQPLSQGETVTSPREEIYIQEGRERLIVLEEAPTMSDVAHALNSVGVSPRDLIAIFQSIKAAGALHADLEII